MATIVVRHAVKNLPDWLEGYRAADALRTKHGCTGERALQDADDPTVVIVTHDFPTLEAARAFMADPELGPAMETAGVAGAPRVEFYNEID